MRTRRGPGIEAARIEDRSARRRARARPRARLGGFIALFIALAPARARPAAAAAQPATVDDREGPARPDAPRTGPAATRPGPAPPPIERPSFRGAGLFVAAGLIAGAGLVQQALSYVLLRGTCGVAQENLEAFKSFEGEQLTREEGSHLASAALFGLACVRAAGPALVVRMQTPIYLGAAVGLASAGGLLRGRATAFDDVFVARRDRSRRARVYRVVGGALIGAGVVLWGASRIGLLDNNAGCDGFACLLAYDLLTLQGSGALTLTGAALLTVGVAHGRHRGRYLRIRDLGASPIVGRGSLGFGVHGRF